MRSQPIANLRTQKSLGRCSAWFMPATWMRHWHSLSAVRMETSHLYLHQAALPRAASAMKRPPETSASISESQLPWPISRSVDGKTASLGLCTGRDETQLSFTPRKKLSSSAGQKSIRESSDLFSVGLGAPVVGIPPQRAQR